MRCKVGDLAVIVISPSGLNIGVLLTVVSVSDGWHWTFKDASRPVHMRVTLPASNSDDVFPPALVLDSWLQPIRDQPGADETLQWAPVPATTKRLTEEEFKTAEADWSKA